MAGNWLRYYEFWDPLPCWLRMWYLWKYNVISLCFFSKCLRSNDSSLKVIFILLLHKIGWKPFNLLCFVLPYQKNDSRHQLLSAVPQYIVIALILIFRYQTLAWFVSLVVQHQEFVYSSCEKARTACTKQSIYQSVRHSSLLVSKQHHQWWNCLPICCPFVQYLRGTSTSWGLLDRKASAIMLLGRLNKRHASLDCISHSGVVGTFMAGGELSSMVFLLMGNNGGHRDAKREGYDMDRVNHVEGATTCQTKITIRKYGGYLCMCPREDLRWCGHFRLNDIQM